MTGRANGSIILKRHEAEELLDILDLTDTLVGEVLADATLPDEQESYTAKARQVRRLRTLLRWLGSPQAAERQR